MIAKSEISRTELDSHANMVVIGNESLIVDWIDGKICNAMRLIHQLGLQNQFLLLTRQLHMTAHTFTRHIF